MLRTGSSGFSPVEGSILHVIRTFNAPSVTNAEGKVDFRTGQGLVAKCLLYGHDINALLVKVQSERMPAAVEDEATA